MARPPACVRSQAARATANGESRCAQAAQDHTSAGTVVRPVKTLTRADKYRVTSDLRVEKRRESAEVTLVTGATLSGVFFLAGSSQLHTGPERVGDVMNYDTGFFPFECDGETSLINRAHVLKVTLPAQIIEAQLDAGYDVAVRRHITIVLATGEAITGHVVVHGPPGRDRLSDYARSDEHFRYLEVADRTLLINAAHIVALTEVKAW